MKTQFTPSPCTRVTACATFLFAAVSSTTLLAEDRTPAASTQWTAESDSLSLAVDGQTLWKFNYGPDLHKPFFHPLAPAGGPTLTWNQPSDHAWHHGLWFSWKYINKVNYWEINRRTGRPDGRTSWSDVETQTRDDGSATISLKVAYGPATSDESALVEKRRIEMGAIEADGSYAIDWQAEFEAQTDVKLDRSPPQPGASGGYAGLSIRFAQDFQDRQGIRLEGPVAFDSGDRFRGPSAAFEYNGLLGGVAAGVAILDGPQNVRHPTPWYLIARPDISYINAALLNDAPLEMKRGERLALHYRIVVHNGCWDAARLKDASLQFSQTSDQTSSQSTND
ncbi:MAG: PmoA family protein [Planctomycetales bacterium]|nr:PmoA family protein [Planctomycetales bacterium]